MASRTIYGAELFSSPNNEVNYRSGVLGKNSAVIAQGDILVASSGVATVTNSHGTSTTVPILGVAAKAYTISSTNTAVALVKPEYIPVSEGYTFLMGTNSDLDKAGSLGLYYALTSASGALTNTGATQVDVSYGAITIDKVNAAAVICVGVDPNNEGGSGAASGLRQGLFKFVNNLPS